MALNFVFWFWVLAEGPAGYFCFFWRLQAVRKFKCVEAHPRTDDRLKQRLATELEAWFGQTSSIRLCFCQTKPHTRNGFGVSFHFLEATEVLRLFKGLSIAHLQSKPFFSGTCFLPFALICQQRVRGQDCLQVFQCSPALDVPQIF